MSKAPFEFVHCADIHLGLKNYGKENQKTFLNTRLEDVLKCLDFMIDYIEEHKIPYLFIAGDVFHSKTPGIVEQVQFAERLRRLSNIENDGVETWILLGNHDVSNLAHKPSVLEIIERLRLEQVRVIRDPETFDLDVEDLTVSFLGPYITQEQALEFVNQIEPRGRNLLFAHPHVRGLIYENEIEANTGEAIWDSNIFSDHYSWLDYVGYGHIHKHQLVYDGPLTYYSGSLSMCSFSEVGETKGFMHVKVDNKTTTAKHVSTPTREFVILKGTQLELLSQSYSVQDKIVRLDLLLEPEEQLENRALLAHFKEANRVVFEVKRNIVQAQASEQVKYEKKASVYDMLERFFEDSAYKKPLLALAKKIGAN